jgi:hypothetical protein
MVSDNEQQSIIRYVNALAATNASFGSVVGAFSQAGIPVTPKKELEAEIKAVLGETKLELIIEAVPTGTDGLHIFQNVGVYGFITSMRPEIKWDGVGYVRNDPSGFYFNRRWEGKQPMFSPGRMEKYETAQDAYQEQQN